MIFKFRWLKPTAIQFMIKNEKTLRILIVIFLLFGASIFIFQSDILILIEFMKTESNLVKTNF